MSEEVFKEMNSEGDVVLIHYEDQPAMYARIEAIEPDIKKDWYQVTLLFLTIPSQMVTWILRGEYINGEPFTMGGKNMALKEVKRVLPESGEEDPGGSSGQKGPKKKGKVLTFKSKSE